MHEAGEKIDVAFGKKVKTSMEVVMIRHIMEVARGPELLTQSMHGPISCYIRLPLRWIGL